MKRLLLLVAIVFASLFSFGQYLYQENDQTLFGYPVPPEVYVFNSDLERWCFIDDVQSPTDNIAGAISRGEAHYIVSGGAFPEAPNDGKQYGRQSENWTEIISSGGGIPSSTGFNYVNFTGTPASSSTDNADSLLLAFTRGDHIFIQSGLYDIGTVVVPEDKAIIFEKGATFNCTGKFTLDGEIQAGMSQIFSMGGDIYVDDATFQYAFPEWFGAKADGLTQSAPAINECLNIFGRADLFGAGVYVINESIEMLESMVYQNNYPYYTNGIIPTLTMGELSSFLIDMAASDDPLFYITTQPVVVKGVTVYAITGYTGWMFDLRSEAHVNSSANWRWRTGSTYSDIKMLGVSYGEDDQNGLAFNGIKSTLDVDFDYSYFNTFTNIYMRRCDTALILDGRPTVGKGMVNNYEFVNFTVDGSARGIHVGEYSTGHTFSNLNYQPNTAAKYPAITCKGNQSTFSGMVWDFQPMSPTDPAMCVFLTDAVNNKVDLGYYYMKDYIDDQSTARQNDWNGIYKTQFNMEKVTGYGARLTVEDTDASPFPTLYIATSTGGDIARFESNSSGTTNNFRPNDDEGTNLGLTTKRWKTIQSANFSDDGSRVNVGNASNGQGAQLRIIPLDSDPSSLPAEGTMWTNGTDNTINIVLGGVKYTLNTSVKP